MNSRLPTIKHAFSKFRVLTADDLTRLHDGEISRSQVYRYLQMLWKEKYVKRRADPWTKSDAFEATGKLIDETHRTRPMDTAELRERDLEHRIGCSRIMIELCKRNFVTGFALEHELGKQELLRFCYNRIPDGAVRVSKPERPEREFAVELELSVKARDRVQEILDEYQKTLSDPEKYRCHGVLLITPKISTYDLYSSMLRERPEWFRDWVIHSKEIDLSDISERALGQILPSAQANIGLPRDLRRIDTHEGVKYLNDFLIRPHLRAHTQFPSQSLGNLEQI